MMGVQSFHTNCFSDTTTMGVVSSDGYCLFDNSLMGKNVYLITFLRNKAYYLIKPLPIVVSYDKASRSYLASFESAGIYFSGETTKEAIDEIEIELVEVYELFKSESRLGERPKQQLAVLEKYIGKSR